MDANIDKETKNRLIGLYRLIATYGDEHPVIDPVENKDMKILMGLNKPCWVRFVYLDTASAILDVSEGGKYIEAIHGDLKMAIEGYMLKYGWIDSNDTVAGINRRKKSDDVTLFDSLTKTS